MKSVLEKCSVLLVAGLIFCCEQKARPDRVLSHEEMVTVLAEVYVTEEKISRLALSPDSATKVLDLLGDNIAEKTGIPDSTFRTSLEYYAHRPQELEKIYSILIDTLHLREQRSASGLNAQ